MLGLLLDVAAPEEGREWGGWDSDLAPAGPLVGSESGVLNTPVGQIINLTAL